FWVNFKVWGMLPITIIFTAFQIPLINKYKLNE
ncbi:septation protein IspZ, partial [bacterium]|nr:septation protein IspZ [bacterium]